MKCWTKVLCVSALIWLSCCCGPSTKTATPPSLSLLISLDCPRISVSGLPSPRIPAGIADFIRNKMRLQKRFKHPLKRSESVFCNFPSGVSAEFSCFVIAAFPRRCLECQVESHLSRPTHFWQERREQAQLWTWNAIIAGLDLSKNTTLWHAFWFTSTTPIEIKQCILVLFVFVYFWLYRHNR